MWKVSLALEPPVAISTARIGEGLLSLRFPRTRLHAASAPVGVQARLGSVRNYMPAMGDGDCAPTHVHTCGHKPCCHFCHGLFVAKAGCLSASSACGCMPRMRLLSCRFALPM